MRGSTICLLLLVPLSCGCAPRFDDVDFDLSNDFELAELEYEKDRLDLGDERTLLHLGRGWSIPKRSSGNRSYVWAMGEQSELRFYMSEPRSLTLRMYGRPFTFSGCPEQRVEVMLNGTVAGGAPVPQRKQWIEIVLPAAAGRAGVNDLILHHAYNRKPADVRDGSTDVRSLAVAWEQFEFVGCRGDVPPHRAPDAPGTVVVPPKTAISAFFGPGQERKLVVDGINGGGELCVSWAVDGEGTADLGCWPADGRNLSVRLSGSAGRPARLRFEVSGSARTVRLTGAKVLGRSRPSQASSSWRPMNASRDQRPNVVLYFVDALRADRLGCYGYDRPTSPHLDRFAERAAVFEQVAAQSSWTKPTVTSLLTGLGALEHGVVTKKHAVGPDLPWVPELLHQAGYQTAAFTANAYLTQTGGFSRGFDTFEFVPSDAAVTTRKAIEWLASTSQDRPYFLWVHTVDPHASYQPRQQFRELLAPDVEDPRIGTIDFLQRFGSVEFPRTPEAFEHLNKLYDAEIAQNDAAFGELLAALDARPDAEETLVVFVSDHGEAFGERRTVGHGWDLYDETLRVPLVIRAPGAVVGRRVSDLVQQIDLAPTILDVVGAPVPEALGGLSMRRLWEGGETLGERVAVAYLGTETRRGFAVRRGPWKAIEPLTASFAPGRELFDVEADPGERHNLVAERPVLAGWLVSMGRRAMLEAPEPLEIGAELSAHEENALRALGYVQ